MVLSFITSTEHGMAQPNLIKAYLQITFSTRTYAHCLSTGLLTHTDTDGLYVCTYVVWHMYSLVPRPIPSFSMLHADTLKIKLLIYYTYSVNMHSNTHMYTRTHTYTHVHTHIHTYTHTHTHTHEHTNTHIHT